MNEINVIILHSTRRWKIFRKKMIIDIVSGWSKFKIKSLWKKVQVTLHKRVTAIQWLGKLVN